MLFICGRTFDDLEAQVSSARNFFTLGAETSLCVHFEPLSPNIAACLLQ